MPSTLTPNMSLILPTAGQEPGPAYATDQNNSFTLVDQHDHSSGKGVAITPAGMSINSDLPMGGNNLTGIRTLRLSAQVSTPVTGLDLDILYCQGVDLYYRDGSGNAIRITQSGGISGTSGSIGGLASPASATYVAGTPAFVFQSAASTPANLDGGALTIRKISASSPGITLTPPSGLASSYSITLPLAPPAATNALFMDSSGNVSAPTMPTFLGGLNVGGSGAVVTFNGALLATSSIQVGGAGGTILSPNNGKMLNLGDSGAVASYPIVVSAAPATAGLKIVRGVVQVVANGAGTLTSTSIISGEGFGIGGTSLARLDLTFSVAFADTPAVTASIQGVSGSFVNSGILTTGIATTTLSLAALPVIPSATYNIHFIAIGQRA